MSSVSVNSPKTPVTEGSNGVAAATVPNVCKMPGPPAPFVPTPLPNIGKSGQDPKNYSKSVTIEGKKVAIRGATFGSRGDVASKGTGGGLISSNVEGPTSFVGPGSMDVKLEGKNVHLLGDPMLNNCGPSGSPANAATLMGVLQRTGFVTVVTGEDACPVCNRQHGALKETEATRDGASALALKLDQMVKSKKRRHLATMLCVVQCKCGQKYADQSGVTFVEFCDVVRDLEWHAPVGSLSIDARDADGVHGQATRCHVRSRLVERLGEENVKERWREAEELADESDNDETKTEPAAYPPGACAAQKTLVFALDKGAYPGGITEQYYHCKGEGRQTAAPIEYFDEALGRPDVRKFSHGTTVPPCRTCVKIVPLMLCPEGEEEQCPHKSNKG